jgi:glycosyltransferase involved in cell wall biosynthesis
VKTILGIVLVKNEDLFLRQAIRNASAFCDHWIFADNGSDDATPGLLAELAGVLPSAELHALRNPADSHRLLQRYAGSDTWVFGLDGDEIYDAAGLKTMRSRLLSDEFANSWMVLGNVLHVSSLDREKRVAFGYASPPCRSMTKLYNFGAIDSWEGYCPERLHGGTPRFRKGFSSNQRTALHESIPWEMADFRCLHVCFLRRSSQDSGSPVRNNLMDIQGGTRFSRLTKRIAAFLGKGSRPKWKNERYRCGPLVRVSTEGFF